MNCPEIYAKMSESIEGANQSASENPSLKNLFPEDKRDLDALFPEPEVKRLFMDISVNLKHVNRFITRIEQDMTKMKK